MFQIEKNKKILFNTGLLLLVVFFLIPQKVGAWQDGPNLLSNPFTKPNYITGTTLVLDSYEKAIVANAGVVDTNGKPNSDVQMIFIYKLDTSTGQMKLEDVVRHSADGNQIQTDQWISQAKGIPGAPDDGRVILDETGNPNSPDGQLRKIAVAQNQANSYDGASGVVAANQTAAQQVQAMHAAGNTAAAATPDTGIESSTGPSCWKPLSIWHMGSGFGFDAEGCAAWGANTVLSAVSWILWIVGILFNFVISYTVIDMAKNIGAIQTITTTWSTFRDLANIGFIFILLYISIATVLRISGYNAKTLLAKLIIVAILMNFSLFFTKVIVDASNIISYQFYKSISITAANGSVTNLAGTNLNDNGLSDAFLNSLKLTSIYTGGSTNGGTNSKSAVTSGGWYNILLTALFGSILLIVVAVIFLFASIVFITRFVTIIILMILSPVAFASMVLPKTSGSFNKWLQALMKEAITAPAFFLMIWVTLKLIQDGGLSAIQNTATGSFGSFANGTASSASSIGLVFNYAVVVGLLVCSLVLAKMAGGSGSGAAMNLFDKTRKGAQGYMGRGGVRTMLAAGNAVGLGKIAGENSRFGNTRVGTALRNITSGAAAKAKFGSARSVEDVNKSEKERKAKVRTLEQRQNIETQLGLGAGGNVPKAVRDIGNDITNVSAKTLAKPGVVQHLTSSQLKAIEKSDKIGDSDKQKIREARMAPLQAAVTAGAGVHGALGNLHPSEVAQLPMTTLGHVNVVPHLNVSMIKKIKEETTQTERAGLRAQLLAAHAAGSPVEQWLRGGAHHDGEGLDF
ncbi:MAG: hypothetical protein PHF79_01095 [Candidatus Pacebacteria bacterium]|nr:hypothetical protein [Candidatus Paceibacterota bacterium]